MSEEYVTLEDEAENEHAMAISRDPAMAVVVGDQTKSGLVDQLQALEGAAIIFDRRCQLLETCRVSSIKATQPEDWVLSKAKDGSEVAMLKAGGSHTVAQYWGIEVFNVRPRGPQGEFAPQETVTAEGRTLTAWCDARSNVTGRQIFSLEASRSSTESFIGRPANDSKGEVWHGDLVAAADLRAAVYTLLLSKATRVLAGLARVPKAQLDLAWEGTNKTSDRCAKGSGYGTSTQRTAGKVSTADATSRDELWKEILRRTGGDVDAARSCLKDITANPPKFAGFDQIERLTQDWQISKAADNLKAHEVFGDTAQQGNGAGEEREPGQEG